MRFNCRILTALAMTAMIAAGPVYGIENSSAPPPARVVTAPVMEKAVAENTKVVGTLFLIA